MRGSGIWHWGVAPAMVVASGAMAQGAQETAVRALVQRFDAARLAHDPGALAATLAPDYEEISPIGEVDTRDQVLGFYAPALKKPAPPMTDDQASLRVSGDVALMTVRKSFTIPGAATRSIRARYVARRIGRNWLLASAQYTPIPPARIQ